MSIMKQAKADGKDAYISVDKLYIDGVQYIETPKGTSSSASMPRRGPIAGERRGQGHTPQNP